MASLALRYCAEKTTQKHRRYIASNVVAMYADDRPPVVQPRRRGRYPSCVKRLSDTPRLYVGAICELRTPLNDSVPVRIVDLNPADGAWIEAVTPRLITYRDGTKGRDAKCGPESLFRTVFGESHV